jgi:hypothetical protein
VRRQKEGGSSPRLAPFVRYSACLSLVKGSGGQLTCINPAACYCGPLVTMSRIPLSACAHVHKGMSFAALTDWIRSNQYRVVARCRPSNFKHP